MGEEVKEKKPNKYVEGFKGFCTFLYNPDDHTVFGRGGSSWGKIIIFYFFFYACLAAFFAICLTVLLKTLDPDRPTVVGRTNKPKLAAPFPNLYTMNFKNEKEWNKYKEATLKIEDKYAGNGDSEGFFEWGDTNLGNCYNPDYPVYTKGRGCFYIGLNRIYDWAPEENQTLSFGCEWVVGKTGSGNLDPPFDMTMLKEVEIGAALKAYYPWTSMENNGLQPVQAIEILLNKEKLAAMDDTASLDTYLDCSAYVNDEKVEDSGSANFEIRYSKEISG